MISETDIAYAAGLFDGEGCVHINMVRRRTYKNPGRSRYYTLKCHCTNTYMPAVFWLRDTFGGHVRIDRNKGLRVDGTPRRPVALWTIQARKASAFLTMCMPYLKVKKQEAEMAIVFQNHMSSVPRGKLPKGYDVNARVLKMEDHRQSILKIRRDRLLCPRRNVSV